MTAFYFIAVTLLLWASKGNSTYPCPLVEDFYPCLCTNSVEGETNILCSNIATISQLQEMTQPLKSMVIDSFTLLDLYKGNPNTIETSGKSRKRDRADKLPSKWLNDVRVRAINILNTPLQNCFLCNDVLVGQEKYLTSLVVKNANLRGRLCFLCNDPAISLQLKELPRAAPLLNLLDLSYNDIDTISTKAFPPNMRNLKQIILSHNKISVIEEEAFVTVDALVHLDLSGNELAALPKRMFRDGMRSLRFLDLSYNSIRVVPESLLMSLPELLELKLNDNLITTISSSYWSTAIEKFKYLFIEGNYIECDCNRLKSLKKHYEKVFGYCVAPDKFAFQLLSEIMSSDDPC